MDVITSTQPPAVDTHTDELAMPNRHLAAVSMIVMGVFLALIVLLHAIKPEFEPSWRFLSEYSIGRHGWVMMTAFFLWAISCFTLSVALREHVKTRGGRLGRAVLVVVGLSLIMAGLFAQDPITARPDELTTHGNVARSRVDDWDSRSSDRCTLHHLEPEAQPGVARSIARHDRDSPSHVAQPAGHGGLPGHRGPTGGRVRP